MVPQTRLFAHPLRASRFWRVLSTRQLSAMTACSITPTEVRNAPALAPSSWLGQAPSLGGSKGDS